ncbi:PAAR-like domain-containing protein [Acinetobacter equi]|uniref:RHS protein n=1 Tax=Acinetobacter equi TaxID=1324350 RepID=A0A0N9VQ67_9GAMM|nr:PAAR-like domain-containing protein [Acinetobacter equi]ALH95481.1 RHS protein [Acinetobacter equi]
MADNLMLRKESGWMVVCTMPDVCKTPPCIPVPYPVVAFLNDSEKTQTNVKANNHPFVLHDKSYVSPTWGDQLGILKGIKSQTVGAKCFPIDKSASFKVNGKWTVRVDDAFWMNGQGNSGNTRGRVVKMPPLSEMIDSALDGLQVALDIAGLIPGIGEIADGINCVICLARGDYEGAALSAAAMIPFAGSAATATKLGKKVTKAVSAATNAATKAIKKTAKKHLGKVGARFKGSGKKCKSGKCQPKVGKPVNPLYGCKILTGDQDTDFSLNSALPFTWQRSYASDSLIGTAEYPISWYGQGWDNPYGMQIKVFPAHQKIKLLLPLGDEIELPYLEPEDAFYHLGKDLTLIREAVAEGQESKDFKFCIAIGTEQAASVFYEFHHQVNHANTKPEYLVLCTGLEDLYSNRISLEYLYTDEILKHYPSHIVDSIQRVMSLEFIEIQGQVRLKQIQYLQGLNPVDPLSVTKEHLYDSLPDRLFTAQQNANIHLLDLHDYLKAKTLVSYAYSDQADLIHVYIDDSSVTAKEAHEYKLRLSRKFEWNNHIMTAHHEVGGISSYYEYDRYDPSGKVIRHWMNTGEEFLFEYHMGMTHVVFAPKTTLEKRETYYFDKYKFLTAYVNAMGEKETYHYNDKQQLIEKKDADGGITQYQYSGSELTKIQSLIRYDETSKLPVWREICLNWKNGRLTQVTDPLGHSETTAYDFAGQPLSISNALGQQTQIKYSPVGMAYQVTDAQGGHKRMLWDMYGNLKNYQDCSGKQTHYAYDAYGRVIEVKDAMGQITHLKYHAHQQQPCEITYPDQSQEYFKYDALERLVEYRDALGRATSYEYSADDLPIQRKDSANGVVHYQYDALRRFVGLINENGQTWQIEYDVNDQVIAETTFDGIRTEYEYSSAGHLVQHRQLTEQQKIRYSTYFKRDLLGQLLEQYIIDHQDLTEKKRTRYAYDLAGQLLEARNADSHVSLSYDAIGQLTQEQLVAHWFNEHTQQHSQRSHCLTHRYDALGNRIETTLPDGRKLKTMYYGSGHAWHYALEDQSGVHEISQLQRDDLHQEIQRSQGDLNSQFKLDSMGRLVEQQVCWQGQSSYKRLEREYRYDQAGQLQEILDKRYHDPFHHNKSHVLHGGEARVWHKRQSYQYDVLSRLTGSELSSQGQNDNYIQIREQFAFDPASNILPIAFAEKSKEKLQDNRVKYLEQDHQSVHYAYDDLGRVIQKRIYIKDQHAFGHIRQNNLSQHTLPNTAILQQFSQRQIDLEWDEQSQLKASTSTKPDGRGGQEIIKTQYYYDPFGRRIAKQSQIYHKSIVQQQLKKKLASYSVPSASSTSSSNQLGSSMNLSLGGTESSPNRIPKHTLSPQKVKREQTQFISKHAVWNVWDGNRILQDYNGRHVFTTVYEADSFVPLARVVWLDEQLSCAANDAPNAEQLETLNNLQQLTLSNLEGFESLDADAFKLPHAQNDEAHEHSSHQIYWYQNDHLGTPRELTEQGGEIAWEAVYQAWGNTVTVEWEERAQPNPIQLNTLEQMYLLQPHRFQGQIYDVETGLHYNRFRYYDPDCGRFISHDPIGLLGGDNHFQYAPNPVEWVDPLGLNAVANIGRLGGKSVSNIIKIITSKGFVRSNPVTNLSNLHYSHPDGSRIWIHQHGDQRTGDFKTGNNAHVHKYDPCGNKLDDNGLLSNNPNEYHIGIKNPKDLPIVRNRPHGAGNR